MLSDAEAPLASGQVHYLKNVLRLKPGEKLRVFCPSHGEFLAAFDGKTAVPEERLRPAFEATREVHLYAPPLAKDRMDFMIEKAVELGMTDYHPLITERVQIRKVNEDRLRAQMIEAAEQCERLDIPRLHKPASLAESVEHAKGNVFAALERLDDPEMAHGTPSPDISIFIGPPGGWSSTERHRLLAKARPLDLGENILRAETAALAALVTLRA